MRRCPTALLLAVAVCLQGLVQAQLTTGILEGILRSQDDRPRPDALIAVTGNPQFRTVIETSANGEFTATLPYGEYLLTLLDGAHASGVTIAVAALQTTRVDLLIDTVGVLHATPQSQLPGIWSEAARQQTFPGAMTLPGLLLGLEPASVTEPLDFTGLSDNQLVLASQRGYSWTDTQYKLLGIDATDSYQPGNPVILPDVQAIEQVVVRSGFAQTSSTSYGTEVGFFLAQPGASWHGAFSTADTGEILSSSNLPRPADRGMAQQANRFRWFTRDAIQAGGPLTSWADLFAMGAAQWSSQTVPLAPPGNNQNSRLLWGDIRGRIRAGARDQFDALYSGSRIDLNNWGVPIGLEALAGRRMSPAFDLPSGFDGESSVDHFDFFQAGWTHRFAEDSGLGVLQARYGNSTAHMNTDPAALQQPTIDLVTQAVTGAPPISTLAARTRQDVEGAWQPAAHRIIVGARWKTSSPRNQVTIPSGVNLIAINGAPSEVVEFNTPLDSRSIIRSFESYATDHMRLTAGLSLDLGILGDFSRGSLSAQAKFSAQHDLIVWNSVSPRAGLAWRTPHLHRLVLRGAYFRLYSPLAGRYIDFGNPNSLSGNVYQWIDRNSDGRFEPGEEGTLLTRFGGAYSSISPSLRRPYADEFNFGAELALAAHSFASIQLFRRDDKERMAAIDTGVPDSAFTPVTIIDPYYNQPLTVYNQRLTTLGKDQYLLTNPPDLRTLSTGYQAQTGTQWRGLLIHVSFVAEKTYGPTNPGNAIFENDPGVIGALFMDPNTNPNTEVNASHRSFTDRAYVGKMQASYRFPARWGGIEVGSIVTYLDGLLFTRELLVTGLAQGPFLLTADSNRAEHVINWNLRIVREFRLPRGTIAPSLDILNAANAGHKIQENDISGPSFSLRLPTAIQEPRLVRMQLKYEF